MIGWNRTIRVLEDMQAPTNNTGSALNNSEIGEISTALGLRKIGFRGSFRPLPEWSGVQRRPGGQGSRKLAVFSGVRACEAVCGGVGFCDDDLELRGRSDGWRRRLHAEALATSPFRTFRSMLDPAQDHADVLSAAAHDRMEQVAHGPLQRAAGSGQRGRRPSLFMCPITGSMAALRLMSLCSV